MTTEVADRTITSYKRMTVTVGVAALLLLSCAIKLSLDYGTLRLEIAFAKEQTQIFEEMRTKALQADTTNAVGFLQYTLNYYPSGTKQKIGSPLDSIVERERTRSLTEIITHLKTQTGENLGNNPHVWIDRYSKQED